MDKTPVAADFMQLPVRVPLQGGSTCGVGTSAVIDYVATGWMKPEDSRLIRRFVRENPVPAELPADRTALFYPSAARDVLTPVLLGLPYCRQFFFYDRGLSRREQQVHRVRSVKTRLRAILEKGVQQIDKEDESVLVFEVGGLPRAVHLVHLDNLEFLERDVDLAFYFHRGDSEGEGGSGQEWDGRLIMDLKRMIPAEGSCMIITDGEPGGIHPAFLKSLERIQIPASHRGRDYYHGLASGQLLRQLV